MLRWGEWAWATLEEYVAQVEAERDEARAALEAERATILGHQPFETEARALAASLWPDARLVIGCDQGLARTA